MYDLAILDEMISVNYDKEDESVPCEYIARLNLITKNPELNTEKINNMLNLFIENTLNDIKTIKENFYINTNILKDSSDMRQVIKLSKKLSKDFEKYINIIQSYKQISSITLDGLDTDQITEIEDMIEEHSTILYNAIKDISEVYSKFFKESNDCYSMLPEDKKELVKNLTLDIINIDIKNINNVESVNEIFNGISNSIKGITGWIINFLDNGWIALLGGFIGYKVLVALWPSIAAIFGEIATVVIKSSALALSVFTIVCISTWIYHKFMNSYNTNKNAPLNRKLNTINAEIKNNPDKGFIKDNTSNTLKDDDVFRGFSNTQGYKPDTEKKDKWGIF